MILGADPGFYQQTTTQVAIITTIGLVIVALIGVITAKVTAGARTEIRANREDASKSAKIAKDYADALEAKNALIESLEQRVKYLENQDTRKTGQIKELERREDEHLEQQRAAAALERNYAREIDDLRVLVDELKRKNPRPP